MNRQLQQTERIVDSGFFNFSKNQNPSILGLNQKTFIADS
jgi:hypothetical protein